MSSMNHYPGKKQQISLEDTTCEMVLDYLSKPEGLSSIDAVDAFICFRDTPIEDAGFAPGFVAGVMHNALRRALEINEIRKANPEDIIHG